MSIVGGVIVNRHSIRRYFAKNSERKEKQQALIRAAQFDTARPKQKTAAEIHAENIRTAVCSPPPRNR